LNRDSSYEEKYGIVEKVGQRQYSYPDEFNRNIYEYHYVFKEQEIHAGDYLVSSDSQERFQVCVTASLQGVYNINKGYTVFLQIEILAQGDEFYTIQKNMNYGLSVYDHIVLNASIIENEGVFIYQ